MTSKLFGIVLVVFGVVASVYQGVRSPRCRKRESHLDQLRYYLRCFWTRVE